MDTTKTVRQIIPAHEMRPEIEEDYRQLKDFRELEDLKSTKLSLVAFHIYAVLPADIRLQLDGILSLV